METKLIVTHLKLDFHRQLFCHTQDKSRWASSHSFADKGQHQNTVDVYKSLLGMGLSASFSLTTGRIENMRNHFRKENKTSMGIVSHKSLKEVIQEVQNEKEIQNRIYFHQGCCTFY